jgi:Tol biopolymer transport system component
MGRRVSYFQSFSPDGKSVVFELRLGSGSHIWKTDRGGVPVQLTSDPNFDDSYPRWSTVDHTIAFNRKPVNEPQTANNLWLVTDDGANPRLLIEKAGNYAWMPDGRALVYFSPVDSQLHLFELSTRHDRVLTHEPKIVQIIATGPDGKWVVYQTLKAGNIDLRAVSIDGGESRAVVETPHQDYHPFVSPSGRWLYFQMDHKNLWRVPGPAQDWRKAEPEKVTNFPESGLFLEDPQISRDGRQLLYSRGRITGDIWIMNLGN